VFSVLLKYTRHRGIKKSNKKGVRLNTTRPIDNHGTKGILSCSFTADGAAGGYGAMSHRHFEMEGFQDVTLVSQSYGGMVATGTLARIPDSIRSMIYLDAFIPEDGKSLIDCWKVLSLKALDRSTMR
jgi:pimeloyl-ACP methyl ester carboxylesterase